MPDIPNGTYPTMITPFTNDLRVDYGALAPLLRFYEDKGAAGVFAICASSEIDHLSFEERLRILREITRARKPGFAVVASGHVALDLPTLIKEAQAFVGESIDAYVFITSRLAARDEDEDVFLRRLERAAGALGNTPLGLYECPSPYKRLVPPETIRRLRDIGNFVFFKDTSCDMNQIRSKLTTAENTNLKLFNANTATLLESLRAGCAGYSGVMGNFHPGLYAKLCAGYAQSPALAERLQVFLSAASLAQYQQYPANAKYHLALEGVPMGHACRCLDASAFTRGFQMEIAHLRALTRVFAEEWL